MTTPINAAPAGAEDVEVGERARAAIYDEGITALRGAFSVAWADAMRADIETAFAEAIDRPGGAVGRGPHRYYVEIHPEQLGGFVELVTHPWVTAVCTAVLGPQYEIVELGFDIPFVGAVNQPWHRDFPMPEVTRTEGRLDSLAFNLTGVDTTDDMGPFEIAVGTQFDEEPDFEHGMFPPKSRYGRYQERAVRKYPQRGDISARSALTIHRGTRNRSTKPRPVLVLGADAPDATNRDKHDMAVTEKYWAGLPAQVRDHLHCPVVGELTPITQKHTIEGLVMGDA